MKFTIVIGDQTVYQDGIPYTGLNTSSIPSNVHALQFDTTTQTGWIEFNRNSDGTHSPNEIINVLPSWANTANDYWNTSDYNAKNLPAPTNQELANKIRSERDGLLSLSDWTQIPDSPLSANVKLEWANYRTALRNIPEQNTFPTNVTWPTSPQ